MVRNRRMGPRMAQNEKDALILGTEKISTLLWKFSLPAIVAMVASSLYNIIAGVFISDLGAYTISGVSLTMPFMNMAAAFGALVGVGASVVCSISLGQKDYAKARRTLANLIILNLVLGIGFSVVGLVFLDPILLLLGASENTLQPAHEFMQIILFGNVFAHMYLGMNSVIRVSGYPGTAMGLTLVSVAINLGLAPLFIYVFEWGVQGAALATVVAQVVCCIILVVLFENPSRTVYIDKREFRLDGEIVKRSFFIGSPNFCTNAVACIVVTFINHALLDYGGEYSDLYPGAYNIVNRIGMLFFLIVLGFSQGMQPIVAYNYGAKKYHRLWGTLKLTLICATCVTTLGTLICELFPEFITSIFVSPKSPNDIRLAEITVTGFRILMMAFWIISVQVIGSNFLASINQPMKSLVLSLTRQLIFLLPALFILPQYLGVHGVWLSIPISDVLAAVAAGFVVWRTWKSYEPRVRSTTEAEPFDAASSAERAAISADCAAISTELAAISADRATISTDCAAIPETTSADSNVLRTAE